MRQLLRSRFLVVTGTAIAIAAGTISATAAEYLLGTQDRLMIRIVEWQTVEGEFRDWAAVTGEYTVGPAGTISLPLAGEMEASGKTTAQVADEISSALQQRLGLSDRPEASVELTAFRPFYITGDVRTPGEYPFTPNMTVLKAVSVAGGDRREDDTTRVNRELLTSKGSYDVLADAHIRCLVKRARIDAEMAGETEIPAPEGYENHPQLDAILADEASIMETRKRSTTLRLEGLDDLKALLESEIKSLEQKVTTQNRQIELAREDLKGLGSLAQEGLVVNTRILSTERSIADMEGKLLDFETAILRAKQDISKASQEAIEITNAQRSELAIERQQTEALINETVLKLATQRGLMAEALAYSAGGSAADSTVRVTYTLVRDVDGNTEEIEADETTRVLPGDVIRVTRALPDATGVPVQ
ncbi:polysaccharide biosynthesis/export family protein [Mesorhizobium sp. CAU 1732]|uniref:polysaccharide biosynthesis/export family protein n=1 Tax=Mesorhizobium sp. CAU 1732 TaxID=3140358 RepID=UPI0032605A39